MAEVVVYSSFFVSMGLFAAALWHTSNIWLALAPFALPVGLSLWLLPFDNSVVVTDHSWPFAAASASLRTTLTTMKTHLVAPWRHPKT